MTLGPLRPEGNTRKLVKKNPHAVALGRMGGQAKTPAKAAAARKNGTLGGRPKKPLDKPNR